MLEQPHFMLDKLVVVNCCALALGKRTRVIVGHGDPVVLLGSEQSKTLPATEVDEVLEEPTTEKKQKSIILVLLKSLQRI